MTEKPVEINEDCKCCGKPVRWCDDAPDEDGDYHRCDHLHCDHCGMHYELHHSCTEDCSTFHELKTRMLEAYTKTD